MKALLLLSFALLVNARSTHATAPSPAPEAPLLWEVTSLATGESHAYLALYGARSSISEGRSAAVLLEGTSDGKSWKRIPLPERIETQSIRAVLSLKEGLYVLSQRLSGDAERASVHRYRNESKRWDLDTPLPGCHSPLRWKTEGKKLKVKCQGLKKVPSVALRETASPSVDVPIPAYQASLGKVSFVYDEVENKVFRLFAGNKEALPSPEELVRRATP